MAPLPKRRHSRARQGKRRQALKIKGVSFSRCPQCGANKRPHTICPKCGSYNGKVVLFKKPKGQKDKKEPKKG